MTFPTIWDLDYFSVYALQINITVCAEAMDAYIISRQTRDACQQSFLAGKPIIMISGNWWQLVTIGGHQWQLVGIDGYQCQ